MTSGTKSFLIGCHQFFLHPLFVLIAWVAYYKKLPSVKQMICILIHDIGIIGKDYLKEGGKDGHYYAGGRLAYFLFGAEGAAFVSGHTDEYALWFFDGSNIDFDLVKKIRSELFIPDKISYLYAPLFWLKWCQWIEGFNRLCTAEDWIEMVKKNRDAGFPLDSHQIYLNLKTEKEG